ncbi:hypothetical protein E2C01_098119 [Portunus trituberculatus]|uniref:Uncharacterized protein n=1 Tax=Portunus trituberculatus TaxID=210409 RepID=A0A5B7K699_PORTR|nr:hypothetical protein [Portunus trituberculatus]
MTKRNLSRSLNNDGCTVQAMGGLHFHNDVSQQAVV